MGNPARSGQIETEARLYDPTARIRPFSSEGKGALYLSPVLGSAMVGPLGPPNLHPPFAPDEYAARLASVQRSMAERPEGPD